MKCSVVHPKFGRCIVSGPHGDQNKPHRYSEEGERVMNDLRTFDVTAMQVDTVTGAPNGVARTERVDTSNPIFRGSTGPWDVEDRYHAFWNRLNDSWESEQRSAKVVVLSVVEVK